MGKELFDLTSSGWRWYGADQKTKDDICANARFDASSLVKINPVRAVFACGGYFIKFEVPDTPIRRWRSIFAPKAASEYASGKALEKAGIPVVEYVCWMRKKAVNAVVSRNWQEGAVSAEEYIFRDLAAKGFGSREAVDFAILLREFTMRMQQSGFRHPDYHGGNMLCSGGRELALVDVYGVRKGKPGYWERLAQDKILLPLRQFMTFEDFTEILSGFPDLAKPGRAEEFYWESRRLEAAIQLKALPKRQLQIANGYPKFIKTEKEYFIRKDEIRRPLFLPAEDTAPEKGFEVLEMEPAEAFALLQASIYLQLCGIRHRRVAAWKAPGTVFLEPRQNFRSAAACGISPRETDLIRKEAELFGVSDAGDIACGQDGIPLLFDLPGVFAGMTMKDEFFK